MNQSQMKKTLLILLILLLPTLFYPQITNAQVGWQWGIGDNHGGNSIDVLGNSVVDASGNVFVSLINNGPNTEVLGSFSNNNPYNGSQLIVTKADSFGNYQWAIGSQSSGYLYPMGMVTDTSGNLYVFGNLEGDWAIIGAYSLINPYFVNHKAMCFLFKISPSGTVLWAENVAPMNPVFAGADFGGMGIDDAGNIYVTARFNEDSIMIGSKTLYNKDSQNVYIAKYTSSGNPIWAISFNNSHLVYPKSFAVTHDGYIYIGGGYNADTLIIGSDTVSGSKRYLAKLDSSGNTLWLENINNHISIRAMTTDRVGNIYMTGSVDTTIILGTDTLLYSSYPGNPNLFTAKYSGSGNVLWARIAGGYYGLGYSITVDVCGNVWVSGAMYYSLNFHGNILNAVPSISDPMFTAEYDNTGNYVTSMALSSGGDDQVNIVVDNRGSFYLNGDYYLTQMVFASDSLTDSSGSERLFIAKYKYNPTFPLPYAGIITGLSGVCVGSNIMLSNSIAGGSWASSNTHASVVGGVVTGISQGIDTISYVVTNMCGTATATKTVIVNTTPAAIGGNAQMCTGGAAITLTNTSTNGTWSGGTTGIATVNTISGVVTPGATQGTAIISYTNSCGTSVITVTVNATPATIGGNVPLCVSGLTITLTNSSTNGTWSGGTVGVANVNSATGLVTPGATQGTTTITYDNGCGTSVTTVTVNATPAAIGGNAQICAGASTITLTNSSINGTWSSSNASVASVDAATGLVTSGVQGTATITYDNGCGTTVATATVNATPAAISGNAQMCLSGTTITLSDASTNGTWSTSNSTVATINSAIRVMTPGALQGTTTITYSNICGSASITATVNATSAAIGGNAQMCTSGSTITLTNTSTNGTWSGGTVGIATVNSTTGIVTSGATQGTTTISYSNDCGSATSITATVNATPSTIGGNSQLCAGGSTITLTNSSTNGTWSTNNTSVVTVGLTSGLLTSGVQGTATITYSNGCGSAANITATVNATPAAIGGNTQLCVGGSTITLTNTATNGTWSSSNTSVALVGLSSGLVTSGVQGTATISYDNSCGTAVATVTVNATPLAIGGNAQMCIGGAAITLTNTSTNGTWSGGIAGIATVDAISGVVTQGVTQGTATISYTNGCGTSVTTVTVNAMPAGIGGNTQMCSGGSTITLTNTSTNGTWSSSNTAVVIVNATTGVVTSISQGTAIISYSNGCGTAVITVTVNATPGPIAGNHTMCFGGGTTITLSDASSGGTWSSDNTSVATVNSTGVVTGGLAGTATIIYSNACGTNATTTITVIPLSVTPAAITGIFNLCVGTSTGLSDTTAGGVWSSSMTSIATINDSGLITGIAEGSTTISYSVANSCGTAFVTTTVIINPLPLGGMITGSSGVCPDHTIILSDSISGGIWSSGLTTITTVSSTGIVSGISAGSVTISYSVTNSCGTAIATKTVTVFPLPPVGPINGQPYVLCKGGVFTLSDSVAGGVWSSSNTALTTINNNTDSVYAISEGTVTITYTTSPNAGGCSSQAILTLTVVAQPTFSVNSTVSQITCYGDKNGSININVYLSNIVILYTWSNGSTSKFLTGLDTGKYILTITIGDGCKSKDTFYITQPDSLEMTPTTKNDHCNLGSGSISVDITGGTTPYTYLWSNNKTDKEITGLTAGTYSVTISDSNGCTKYIYATVNEDTCNAIIIHNVITPNGDGINDTWVIEGISEFPNNTVQLFDKWGDMVYENNNYKNDWGGNGISGKLPDGTYYYLVKLNAENTQSGRNTWTGYLMIKR